jgi:hypothetical protein
MDHVTLVEIASRLSVQEEVASQGHAHKATGFSGTYDLNSHAVSVHVLFITCSTGRSCYVTLSMMVISLHIQPLTRAHVREYFEFAGVQTIEFSYYAVRLQQWSLSILTTGDHFSSLCIL